MNRLTHLSAAFRTVPLTCGELTLRPITAGTVMLLMDTGNPLFADTPEAEPTEADHMQGLFEFIYIHTADETEVIESCEDPGLLRKRARALALHVDFEALGSFAEQFGNIRTRLNASVVETVREPGEGKPPGGATPAPIGSPPSSTASADAAIPPASDGSSGGSPSTEPSNTSTPPSARTESEPAGRSRIWEDPEPEEREEALIPLP